MKYGFISELHAHLVDDCYWNLDSPLIFVSKVWDEIIVPAGFQTDFASVPRIPFIYDVWGGQVDREAALHDYVCCKDSIPLLSRKQANELFLEAMESRNVPNYIKYPMYWGVRMSFDGFDFHIRSYKTPLDIK